MRNSGMLAWKLDSTTRDGVEYLPEILDLDEYFTERLRQSRIGDYVANSNAPPWRVETDLDLLLDTTELIHRDLVALPIVRHEAPDMVVVERYDQVLGQVRFRDEMNAVLALHTPAFELMPNGHIVERDEQHRRLYVAPLPEDTEDAVRGPVDAAIAHYLRRGASIEERRSAVKQLADALEHLRPEVKEELLSEDERALFRIANEFTIRHNRRDQRGDYDRAVWLAWAFHVYLATIRAVLALRQRSGS